MWSPFFIVVSLLASIEAHGRVESPPSRASAWRAGFPTEPDYDDDGVNCGGMWHQWSYNRGRCGICGDRYDAPTPRPHELGGRYGDGIVVAHYNPGAIFTATVHLTTSHLGFWEFKLCPDPKDNAQDCFDQYPLELENGGTKYYPKKGSVRYNVNYRLPPGLMCEHCVLQWRYTAGNNWGVCSNGTQGLGCGNQEQFGACSDISIGKSRIGSRPVEASPLLYYLSRGYIGVHQDQFHLNNDSGSSKINKNLNKIKGKKRKHKNKKKSKPHKQKKMLIWR